MPRKLGFMLPYRISAESQSAVIQFLTEVKHKGGFRQAENGNFVEPWYFFSFRSMQNREDLERRYPGVPISDFIFRFEPFAKWIWVSTQVTSIVMEEVSKLRHLYIGGRITRVTGVLQRPGLDLPLHRDRVMGELYEDAGPGPYNPLGHAFPVTPNRSQSLQRNLTLKIPLTLKPADNGKPILEINDRVVVYDVADRFFALNEVDVRHGCLAPAHYRGVIAIDGSLDLAKLDNEQIEPIPCRPLEQEE